jgi:dolichyl-phosphate-mannose--protein O-mannosyl transferase
MALPASGPRRDLLVALLIALAAAALRLPHLGAPQEEVFDEVYHAKSALQYLRGEAPVDWVHPPTSKLLIAIGVWAFGYKAWAWRLAPALAGTALAFVFYLLARRVTSTERAALLAAGLLLCDGVYLVQSRIAMTNIFAVLFQVSLALFVLRAGLAERPRALDILAAGLALGLALSTRWTSLFAAAFLMPVFLILRGRRIFRLRELGLCFVAFVLVPPALYILSYVPWMHQGHSLREVVTVQKDIWNYHATLNAQHPYFSSWYSWPWLYRPTLYAFNNDGTSVRGILALGNPALWWLSIPVTVWALVTGVRERDPRLLFAGAGFCGLYLPWGMSPRTLNFSHYLFEAIPYACLALGMLLDRVWDRPTAGILARGYVGTVVLLFAFFFPFLTAIPIPVWLFYKRFPTGGWLWWWFPTWV